MKRIITYFITYPIAGNILMVALMLFGVVAFFNLRSSFFPQYESEIIRISAVYPGASPQEVEEGIIVKIEENLQGISGIDRVSSVSSENLANITIEVFRGKDIDLMVQDVKNAIDRISSFPEGMENLIVYKDEGLNFAISFALYGDVDLHTLKAMAEKVKDDLMNIQGISKIGIAGYPEEEIEVAFKEERLRAFNLSFEQAAAAVRNANLRITGGTIKSESEELLIRANNKGYYAEEILNTIVKATPDGRVIYLKDVAEVRDRWADVPNKRHVNGRPAAVIGVSNTNDEDILFITETVRNYVDKFNRENDVVHADVIIDTSVILQQRIDLLVKNGEIGALLVFVFLALFLRMRLAFWVALSIPVSFLGMFIIGSFAGLTINVMSLFGMILVVGILVDDGIVIGENIYTHFERGKNPLRAAIDGTLEVLPAVTAAVLTTIVAFSTFFFLDGRLGNFAPDLALVVIGTLAVSLLEGAFILPAHIAHSRDLHLRDKKLNFLDKIFEFINSRMDLVMGFLREKLFAPFFNFSMRNKGISIGVPVALFILTIGAMRGGIIKFTFFPFIERDEISIDLEFPAGTRQETTEKWLEHIEARAWALNDSLRETREDKKDVVLKIERQIAQGKHIGQVNVMLLDGETRNMKILQFSGLLRNSVGDIEGSEKLSYGIRTPFGKPLSVSLQSNNITELEGAKDELKEKMREITNLTDVVSNDQVGNREVSIKLKPNAHHLGLTLASVVGQIRQGFFGYEVQRLQRGEDEVKIWVRYDEENRSSLGNLEDMRIRTATGLQVPLREVADYTIDRGVMSVNHLYGKREIRIEADIANSDVSSTDIQLEIDADILPPILAKYPSVNYTFEGQSRESGKVFKSIIKVFPIILIFMLAIIILAFRSVAQGLLVLFSIAFGFIGVAWGHYLHGAIISMLSNFGIIALIGIMVNDSLVLISAMNGLLRAGRPFHEAVTEAAISRFRPIFLTSVTTIAGLGPLILERSFQAQFLVPMAISVAYGLAIATYVTLIVLPVALILINRARRSWVWLWTGEMPTHEEVEPAVREMKYEKEENV